MVSKISSHSFSPVCVLTNVASLVIFAPDIDTITIQPVIEDGLSNNQSQLVVTGKDTYKYLYFNHDTIELAKHTVHLIACALGTKRSAFLIDGCFADMFQSCVEFTAKKSDEFLGINQSLRQLEWSGSCVFANEVRLKDTKSL